MTFSVDHSSDPLHCSSLPPSEDKRKRTPKIPTLQDLVSSTRGSAVVPCPQGNLPINSKPTTNTSHLLVSITKYKIPFQIHQTVKTRCVTPEVHALSKSWQDLGIPYYLHDDHSMDALILSEASDAFPQLKIIWKQCLRVPAAKADLWRMLLLWTYGGICK
jgi:Glycosyltransferase sugar-binding region containing DXD motif